MFSHLETLLQQNKEQEFIDDFSKAMLNSLGSSGFLSTIDIIRLLRLTVQLNNPKVSMYIIVISGVNLETSATRSGWKFGHDVAGKKADTGKAHQAETEKIFIGILTDKLDENTPVSKNHFIRLFIKIIKENPNFLSKTNLSFLLYWTFKIRDPQLSALIIISGVDLKRCINISDPTGSTFSWEFGQVDNLYKQQTEDQVCLLRYKQFISRQHPDKISASMSIITSEGIFPLSYINRDLTSSERESDEKDSKNAVIKLRETLEELPRNPTYKHIWPIFKLVGLAVQGLHRSTLLSTNTSLLDERLLIRVDRKSENLDNFVISAIGTILQGKSVGKQNYQRKEIYIAGDVTSDELFSTFLHESMHFVLCDVYDNYSSYPYHLPRPDFVGRDPAVISFQKEIIDKFNKYVEDQVRIGRADNIPRSLFIFYKEYIEGVALGKRKPYEAHAEFFSYFIEGIFMEEINIDDIRNIPGHPLYIFYEAYNKYVFAPAVEHYRSLTNSATKKRKEIVNRSNLSSTNTNPPKMLSLGENQPEEHKQSSLNSNSQTLLSFDDMDDNDTGPVKTLDLLTSSKIKEEKAKNTGSYLSYAKTTALRYRPVFAALAVFGFLARGMVKNSSSCIAPPDSSAGLGMGKR